MTKLHARPDPSILHESPDKSVILLDIPRTLELAQLPPYELRDPPPDHRPRRRILSAQPPSEPYATPEPKAGLQNKSPAAQVADLMAAATVESALGHLRDNYAGPWHFPRVLEPDPQLADQDQGKSDPHIPVEARFVQGSLEKTSHELKTEAPVFDLIVLDPPWPNRSARRKTDSYSTVYNMADMDVLLDQVPVSTHLSNNGLVAVWITNNSSVLHSVTSQRGLFAYWNLEMVAEWTWVKITDSGEPMYDVHSEWRKPWEKILIAKRVGSPTPEGLTSKTIIAIPDVHSRKPNLRGLFRDILGPEHVGLEVFARNLTAGWWAWGDEPLRFQMPECWTAPQEKLD